MRYNLPAKNKPTKIKQLPAPNGSSTTPFKPLFTNLAGIPKTVSAPNHVAKVVVTIMASGKCLPAMAKSAEVLTRFAATKPMAMVTSK